MTDSPALPIDEAKRLARSLPPGGTKLHLRLPDGTGVWVTSKALLAGAYDPMPAPRPAVHIDPALLGEAARRLVDAYQQQEASADLAGAAPTVPDDSDSTSTTPGDVTATAADDVDDRTKKPRR